MKARARRRRRAARRVQVEARAKLNLGLVVGPRRGDGYHDLGTIFQSVSLSDTLVVEPRRSGFSLVVRHEEVAIRGGAKRSAGARVPGGRSNLVLRAADLFARRTGLEDGARFTLIKRIPTRAGLGGGSADAAAAIAGLAALYRIRLPARTRLEHASALGSDVPFALLGGTAIGRGRGEILEPLTLAAPFRVVIAVPRWRVSTAQAYARIDKRKYVLTLWNAKLRSLQLLGRKQLRAEDATPLGNTFEKVLGSRQKDFLSLRNRLLGAGVSGVRMTGSGSAVFGILKPGTPVREVVARFTGNEALYSARSVKTGWRLTKSAEA